MSRKMEFAERASQPGAKLAAVCREFGVSRQTGYKWLTRFREHGFEGLEEQSRRPKSSPLALGEEVVAAVLEARDAHPTWGPKKIQQLMRRKLGDNAPSRSTVARMLRRFGRIRERRARRPMSVVEKAPTARADQPNDVWTVDFKGWWQSLDGSRCEPLTVRDAHSRYLLAVTLTPTSMEHVKPIFEALFRKHGLPAAIQCDNGPPFVCVAARGGLSRLSAWWVSLGIRLVRGRPACPQDNGGHERMHRDIATEVENAPAPTRALQQRILDRWRQEFNQVRPHDALDGKTPAECYRPSERRCRDVVPASYPPHFVVKRVAHNGVLSIDSEKYFVGKSLCGHLVGLEPLDDLRWRVWFYNVDCGELETLPRWFDALVANAPPSQPHRLTQPDAPQRAHKRPTAVARRQLPQRVAVSTSKSVKFLSTGS
jgi:transposase InsO family protein